MVGRVDTIARMNMAQNKSPRGSAFGLAAVLLLALHPLASPRQAGAADYFARRVHDPCVAKENDNYYVLSTTRGIDIRQSTDLVNWHYVGRVFDAIPDWARREIPGARDIWAPDVSRFNGEHHLYYAVSTFGSKHSCIGLATNKTLDPKSPDYHWKDCGKVIQTGDREDFNAIDPSIVIDGDAVWLCFGSYWSGIKLCRIDAATGKPADSRLISLASRPQEKSVEAPFIVRHGKYYYLFVSFDHCCRGVNSDYKIMVGRADRVDGTYSDRQGRPMLEGGGTLVLQGEGRVRGPGGQSVLVDGDKYWLVYHFYDAENNGIACLQIRPLKWQNDWPVAGDPLPGMKQPDNSRPF
jgi:arabinan endo-1,5-alpha-L-arabinosidase